MDIKRQTCDIQIWEKHLFLIISETFATFLNSVVKRFTLQTLPTVNGKHFFMNILCIESFCPQKKTHNRMLLFGSKILKHGRHFDY
jgi:hypothetical protein